MTRKQHGQTQRMLYQQKAAKREKAKVKVPQLLMEFAANGGALDTVGKEQIVHTQPLTSLRIKGKEKEAKAKAKDLKESLIKATEKERKERKERKAKANTILDLSRAIAPGQPDPLAQTALNPGHPGAHVGKILIPPRVAQVPLPTGRQISHHAEHIKKDPALVQKEHAIDGTLHHVATSNRMVGVTCQIVPFFTSLQ